MVETQTRQLDSRRGTCGDVVKRAPKNKLRSKGWLVRPFLGTWSECRVKMERDQKATFKSIEPCFPDLEPDSGTAQKGFSG